MITWYDSYDQALARVRLLCRELGIWPGITGPCPGPGGPRWRLVFDPPEVVPVLWKGFS